MPRLARLQNGVPQSCILFSLSSKILGLQKSATIAEIYSGLSKFPNPERVDVVAETSDLLAKRGLISGTNGFGRENFLQSDGDVRYWRFYSENYSEFEGR